MKLFVCLISGLVVALTNGQDYCDPELCDPGVKHVGCNNPNDPAPECGPEVKKIVLTDAQKQQIVDQHNDYRNRVAKGELKWLPKAAKMVAMAWDEDLAYLAELNSNQCEAEHDKCRNTESYPNSGQNIDTFITNATSVEVDKVLPMMVEDWYNERHRANRKMVKKLYEVPEGVVVYHFTMMTRDIANRVGCALVQFKRYDWLWLNLVCNYSYTNMVGTPIYVQGEPCSECTTGCDSKFDGLCNSDEPVELD